MRNFSFVALALACALASPAFGGNIFDFDDVPAKPSATGPAPVAPPGPPIKVTETVAPPIVPPAPDEKATPTPAPVPDPNGTEARREVPPKPDLDRSTKLLRETFAKQLEDHSLPGRRKLAEALLAEAAKDGEPPPDQYVLLAAAVNAARESANLRSVVSASAELSKRFAVDARQVKLKALTNLTLKSDTLSSTIDNLVAGFDVIDALAADGDFTLAARLCAQLRPAAAGDPVLASIVQKRQGELDQLSVALERAEAQADKLKAAPDDPAANLAVGTFTCFFADNWPAGLKMLAKGSDADMKKLAGDDLAAADADAWVRLGDAWWGLSSRYSAAVQFRIRRHAASLYAKAEGKIAAPVRAKVEGRAAEVAAAEANAANGLAQLFVKQQLARIKELTERNAAGEKSTPRTPYPVSAEPLSGDVPLPAVKGGYTLVGTVDVGYNASNHGKDRKDLVARLKLAPGACVEGGTLLVQNGRLELIGEPENPVVLRNVHVACELTGHVKAQYAIFEHCTFTKDGSYFWVGAPSAKFELKDSLLIQSEFKSFSFGDSGIKFDGCSFVACTFPDRDGHPAADKDSLAIARHEWSHVADCDFYNCATSASFYLMPDRCNFYHCKISDEAAFRSAKSLKVELGLPGDDRAKFLAELTARMKKAGEGAIAFAPATVARYPTASYP